MAPSVSVTITGLYAVDVTGYRVLIDQNAILENGYYNVNCHGISGFQIKDALATNSVVQFVQASVYGARIGGQAKARPARRKRFVHLNFTDQIYHACFVGTVRPRKQPGILLRTLLAPPVRLRSTSG